MQIHSLWLTLKNGAVERTILLVADENRIIIKYLIASRLTEGVAEKRDGWASLL